MYSPKQSRNNISSSESIDERLSIYIRVIKGILLASTDEYLHWNIIKKFIPTINDKYLVNDLINYIKTDITNTFSFIEDNEDKSLLVGLQDLNKEYASIKNLIEDWKLSIISYFNNLQITHMDSGTLATAVPRSISIPKYIRLKMILTLDKRFCLVDSKNHDLLTVSLSNNPSINNNNNFINEMNNNSNDQEIENSKQIFRKHVIDYVSKQDYDISLSNIGKSVPRSKLLIGIKIIDILKYDPLNRFQLITRTNTSNVITNYLH